MVTETFSVGDGDGHVVGDPDCAACWSSPKPHDCDSPRCLEHNEWGDENSDGDYWLYHLGDLCRET